jgi:hypothetical protein
LFLGVDREVVLLTLHNDEEEQAEMLSYTKKMVLTLQEYLSYFCNTSILALGCCISIGEFQKNPVDSSRSKVKERLELLLPYYDGESGVLTSGGLSDVRNAAACLLAATRVPNLLVENE